MQWPVRPPHVARSTHDHIRKHAAKIHLPAKTGGATRFGNITDG